MQSLCQEGWNKSGRASDRKRANQTEKVREKDRVEEKIEKNAHGDSKADFPPKGI